VAVVSERLSPQEIERENPTRVVWHLAWPAVALNSLQVVNTLLDRGFIARLEPAALTAHGGATNVLFLMFSLAIAIATGATALVSRAFGAGNAEEYRTASRQVLGLAVVGGFLLAAATYLLAPIFSTIILPAEDPAAIALMTRFLQAYALGLPAIYVIQSLAGSLRAIGDTRSPMVISGFQIFVHIVLNFLLIFPTRQVGGITLPGAGLGLVGAGVALSISAWIAAAVYLAFAGRTPLGELWRLGLPMWDWTKRILRISIPAAMMSTLRVLSLTAFTLILALVPNGSVAIAAMTVGFAIESIMFMPPFGLSMAAATLVGQSLGMKRPDRAERLAWVAGHHGALVTVALAVPIFVFAPTIASFMLGDKADIVREAALMLRLLCVTEVFFAYAMILIGAMQGAGDTVRPLWISVFSLWALRVPLALVMALETGTHLGGGIVLPVGFGMGAAGAWAAMAITQGVQGILAIVAWRQGAWKMKEV
jgi:putative MATE family efflux protein